MGLDLTSIQRSNFAVNRDGSIAVLTLSLFSVVFAVALILVDITSVYFDKKSLTTAVEAAAQRGASQLNYGKYYDDKFNLIKFGRNFLGEETIVEVPIDCEKGLLDAQDTFINWESERDTLQEMGLRMLDCNGSEIKLEASGKSILPISLPFIRLTEITLISRVGASARKVNP